MPRHRTRLLLLPGLPVAAEWRRAMGRDCEVVAVRFQRHRTTSVPQRPDGDGVYTIGRPRRHPTRARIQTNARIEADALVQLVDQLRAEGHDLELAHGHFASASGALPILRARRDIPYVVSEHSSALTFDNPDKQVSRAGLRAARIVYENADAVLPVSSTLGDAMVGRRLVATDKLSVVPNPVDGDLFRLPGCRSRQRRVITVARLVRVKRLELLLDAIAVADRRAGPVFCDVVGDGPRRRPLAHHADRLGLGDRVTFHGHLDRPAVAAALRGARVFASTSFTENMPVAALEALASGLPLVAPMVGGFPEILEHAPGTLVDVTDPASLADALLGHLDGDADQADVARQASRRYHIDTVSERLEAVYDLVQRRRTAPAVPHGTKG